MFTERKINSLLFGRYMKIFLSAGFNKNQGVLIMSRKEELHDGVTFRLPKNVKPIQYDLYLYPDLGKGTFEGKVTIVTDIIEKRDYIYLHQKELNIISTKVTTIDRAENWEIELKEPYAVDNLETWVITAKKEFPPGLYNITLEFEGALQPDKIVGFYSSTYKDADKKTR